MQPLQKVSDHCVVQKRMPFVRTLYDMANRLICAVTAGANVCNRGIDAGKLSVGAVEVRNVFHDPNLESH